MTTETELLHEVYIELLAHGEFGTSPGANFENAMKCAKAVLAIIEARRPPPSGAEQGEAVATAYLHTLHMELEQSQLRLSFSGEGDQVFGLPGKDYSSEYSVTIQPLYLRPAQSQEGVNEPVAWEWEGMTGTLVCDVLLPPSIIIRAGCKLSTLFEAMSHRPGMKFDATSPQEGGE